MDDLLEFTTAYKSQYKDKFHQNAENFFSTLVEKSAVDVEANRQTAARYREWQQHADNYNRISQNKKSLRTFLIVLAVLAVIGILVCIVLALQATMLAVTISVAVVLLAGTVAIIVVIVKVISPAIKHSEEKRAEALSKAQQFFAQCKQQLAPLFALYDNFCTFELIQQTVPLFRFDRNFNVKRHDYFRGKYGQDYKAKTDRSTVDVFSGEINGNPFFLQKELNMRMGTHVYYGSIVISWTETVRDSQGHSRTVTRTQTLTASVTKPKPNYSYYTRLVFATDAAPDLSFSRTPTDAEKMSEKELQKFVKAQHKKIRQKAAKAVQQGGGFTEMGNTEFDALFGADNRDHEVQFRLLFTPLAQKNMLELIKNPDPYGDDFTFIKQKCVNIVASEHSQKFDYSVDTNNFVSYDVDLCKKQFLDYNDGFFRSLYFEFAPLMAIPLYQQHKPVEYIYKHEYESHHTMYEAEVLANRLDASLLAHPASKTAAILSAHLAQKRADEDVVEIDAYSFDTQELVEYVTVWGGDGRPHSVPVHYYEYIPLENQTLVTLQTIPTEKDSKKDENGGNYSIRHGLLAQILKNNN